VGKNKHLFRLTYNIPIILKVFWALPYQVGLFAKSFGSMRTSPKANAAIPSALASQL